MIAETERLLLREFLDVDLDALASIFADPLAMRFSLSGPKTRAETRAFIERCRRGYTEDGYSLWAIIHKTGGLIGYCGCIRQEVDGRRESEIGYRLDSDYWGRGLATEAARASRDYAVQGLGLSRLISIIEPANAASIRVAEKMGMTFEKETRFHDVPALVYALETVASEP